MFRNAPTETPAQQGHVTEPSSLEIKFPSLQIQNTVPQKSSGFPKLIGCKQTQFYCLLLFICAPQIIKLPSNPCGPGAPESPGSPAMPGVPGKPSRPFKPDLPGKPFGPEIKYNY